MRLLVAALIATALVAPSTALAAKVNCSYDACVKVCQRRGATTNGCSLWCTNALSERQNAGQCPRK